MTSNLHESITGYVEQHNKQTAVQIADGLQRKHTSVSACLSEMIRARQIKRLKNEHGEFIYSFTEGEWGNNAIQSRRHHKKNGHNAVPAIATAAPLIPAAPVIVPVAAPEATVLMTLQYGSNQSFTVTVAEAKRLYLQLSEVFAR